MEQRMHGFRAHLDYWLKHSKWFNKVFLFCGSMAMRFFGMFTPIDKNMVIFSAHSRKYNDSPRTIYEAMLKDPRFKNMKYVWALEDVNVEVPGNPIKVHSDTWDYFKYTWKAKYWCTCVNIERAMHYKKKNQVYLNTWHGCSLNACGNGAHTGINYIDFSNIDYMCYESEFHKEILIRDFLAKESSMLASGLPRNDELYYITPEHIVEIKEKLGLPKDKKILMYAPTWRDSTDHGETYAIKPPINIGYWEENLADKYVMILRTHAYTNKLLGIEFNDFCRNFTDYPRINDLFAVADILISDYSSCIADFSILERPEICFAYDYDTYKVTRGLNFDFEHGMPSGVIKTEQEVVSKILSMDYEKECQLTRDMIKNKVTNIGGHATEICINALFKDYKG